MDDMGLCPFFRVSLPPASQPRIEPYPLQIYFIARVAALLFVILMMFGYDTTSPINCQVGPVYHAWPYLLSDQLYSQGLDRFCTCERLILCAQAATPNALFSFYSGLWLSCRYCLIVVDCDSRVCL